MANIPVCSMTWFPSSLSLVTLARDRCPAIANLKIEIVSFRGLHHVLYVESILLLWDYVPPSQLLSNRIQSGEIGKPNQCPLINRSWKNCHRSSVSPTTPAKRARIHRLLSEGQIEKRISIPTRRTSILASGGEQQGDLDARTATYLILSTGSGPGGWWFKSTRPDQLF
jgi:hypothetical protein